MATGPSRGLPRIVEEFARDLLALVRGVRVYPADHPFLKNLSTRLIDTAFDRLPHPLSLGVAARELAVGNTFVGGADSRAEELAVLLGRRKILRLLWARDVVADEVLGLANLLADARLTGARLRDALRSRKIYALDVEPLALERIHDSFRETAKDETPADGPRTRKAWQWLLDDEASPGRIAELLASAEFWENEDGNPAAAGTDPVQMTEMLVRMGQRLGAALDTLPPDQRATVEGRLSTVGQHLSPRELARILQAADTAGVLRGPVGDALEETFGGDKLIDLLASLVALEGRNTHRLAAVYSRFSPDDIQSLMPTLQDRLRPPGGAGFPMEVWKAVEDFLLELQEDPFMAAEYSSSLEVFASTPSAPAPGPTGVDFSVQPEPHLDRVALGLAVHDPDRWSNLLVRRLEERIGRMSVAELLTLATKIDEHLPGWADARPDLCEKILHRAMESVRELSPAQRKILLGWGRTHEGVLLETIFRSFTLSDDRITRKFLVELVTTFSPAATPPIISRMRMGPWYVTRNLALALGRKREVKAVPALLPLLHHDHPKVRREAIAALGRFDADESRRALSEVAAGRGGSSAEERNFAASILQSPRGEAS